MNHLMYMHCGVFVCERAHQAVNYPLNHPRFTAAKRADEQTFWWRHRCMARGDFKQTTPNWRQKSTVNMSWRNIWFTSHRVQHSLKHSTRKEHKTGLQSTTHTVGLFITLARQSRTRCQINLEIRTGLMALNDSWKRFFSAVTSVTSALIKIF